MKIIELIVYYAEDMLSQFVPPSDSFNYNSVQPDPHFIRQMQRGSVDNRDLLYMYTRTYVPVFVVVQFLIYLR